jgi:hypothetical protein
MQILLRMLKAFTMWKPDCLYESMPYIYSVVGLGEEFIYGNT